MVGLITTTSERLLKGCGLDLINGTLNFEWCGLSRDDDRNDSLPVNGSEQALRLRIEQADSLNSVYGLMSSCKVEEPGIDSPIQNDDILRVEREGGDFSA